LGYSVRFLFCRFSKNNFQIVSKKILRKNLKKKFENLEKIRFSKSFKKFSENSLGESKKEIREPRKIRFSKSFKKFSENSLGESKKEIREPRKNPIFKNRKKKTAKKLGVLAGIPL